MSKQKNGGAKNRLVDKKSVGAFKANAWLEEGDRLLAVARLNRSLFRRRRRSFHENVRKTRMRGEHKAKLWNELEGSPRASWLLLGYAVEMYLKAGLARAYAGCAESMFKRDVKSRFSHDLFKIAQEIAFPLDSGDAKKLRELKERLLAGRYPLFSGNEKNHMEKTNAQTSKLWDDDEFQSLYALAKRVRAHAARIDRDRKNPASRQSVRVDDDGYVTFRMGGHLPTRITYRVSSKQKKAGRTALQDMIDLFRGDDRFHLINRHWPSATIFEDGENDKGQKTTISRS